MRDLGHPLGLRAKIRVAPVQLQLDIGNRWLVTVKTFSHVENTRHRNWKIIGVAESADAPGVTAVEIYVSHDSAHPALVLAPEEVPQFIAGLVATVMPGDLTAEDGPDDEA